MQRTYKRRTTIFLSLVVGSLSPKKGTNSWPKNTGCNKLLTKKNAAEWIYDGKKNGAERIFDLDNVVYDLIQIDRGCGPVTRTLCWNSFSCDSFFFFFFCNFNIFAWSIINIHTPHLLFIYFSTSSTNLQQQQQQQQQQQWQHTHKTRWVHETEKTLIWRLCVINPIKESLLHSCSIVRAVNAASVLRQ